MLYIHAHIITSSYIPLISYTRTYTHSMDGSSSSSSSSNGGSVNRLQIVTSIDGSSGSDEAASGGYKCKTCRKRFDSFQALGGHQGIHKKQMQVDNIDDGNFLSLNILGPVKSSSSGLHQCKLCMKVFESGPALGGHMTRHRKGKNLVESTNDDVKDDEEQKKRRELILAAKEWRLNFVWLYIYWSSCNYIKIKVLIRRI